MQGPFEALSTVPLPAIVHTRNTDGTGHFIVLHRAAKHSVIVGDPAREGIDKLSREAFGARWTGYLLLLTPDPERLAAGADAATVSSLRRFLHLLAGHVPILVEAFIRAILMTALGVATSF